MMDTDGVVCTGATREHSDALAAPITYSRGLKVVEYLREQKEYDEKITVTQGFSGAGGCEMHLESIPGDGDCAWTSIVTALVKEKRSDLDDVDHILIRDRVAKLKYQTM